MKVSKRQRGSWGLRCLESLEVLTVWQAVSRELLLARQCGPRWSRRWGELQLQPPFVRLPAITAQGLRDSIQDTRTNFLLWWRWWTDNIRPARPPQHLHHGLPTARPVGLLTQPLYTTTNPANGCSSSLYRQSLKLALDWTIHRHLWRGQAMYIRSLFEANKHVTQPRQQRVR